MKTINAKGSYTIPAQFDNAGAEVNFDFPFHTFEKDKDLRIEVVSPEAKGILGTEDNVLAMINQTHKEDCRNNASGAAKSANGHSTRASLTPEEKEERNKERKADRELLKALKAKGLSLKDLMNM